MLRYALRRVPTAVLVLFVASVAIFLLLHLTPGNPAEVLAGPDGTPATIAAISRQLGLDQPLPVQYWQWISGLLTGNLGHSYLLGGPVASLIAEAAGNTVELAVGALVVALVLGLATGILAATTRNRAVQTVLYTFNTLSLTVPQFVVGLVLILVFAVAVRLLPPGGQESLLQDPGIGIQYLILPAITLGLPTSAVISRFLQTSLRRTLGEDYIKTARAKGLSPLWLLFRHALPNALPPVITIIGIQVGHLLGGAVLVETIFAWPGLGQLIQHAITGRDYLMVQDLVLLAVAVFIATQIATDLLQAALDPRVRLEG